MHGYSDTDIDLGTASSIRLCNGSWTNFDSGTKFGCFYSVIIKTK